MTGAAGTPRLSRVNVRRSLAVAVLVLGAPVLSSCGGNFDQQTNQVYNPAAGVDDRSGQVDVLNALIVSGEDGSGTLIASLVNNAQDRPDTLKGVTGAGKDADLTVTPGGTTEIPQGGMLNLADVGRIFVKGDRVKAGYFVEVTFTFDRGTAITVDVPVVSADNATYADVPLPPAS